MNLPFGSWLRPEAQQWLRDNRDLLRQCHAQPRPDVGEPLEDELWLVGRGLWFEISQALGGETAQALLEDMDPIEPRDHEWVPR